MTRVLVVDDEAAIADVIADILDGEGYEVATVPHGAAALAAMERSRPDIVLLDMMMPVLDGPATLEKMREREELRDVRVVLMSAAREPDARARAAAIPFLRKPFEIEDLLAMVARVSSA